MKKPSILEQTHSYCQICGAHMEPVVTQAASKFDRRTGDEIPGEKFFWWTCPNWQFGHPNDRHDREVLAQ